jgi:formamidopyrimidine-DNA glycosylase
VDRRAKYLLFRTSQGTAILHLGMSGSLRVLAADTPAEKHDHVDFVFPEGLALRLRDPRRFGSLHFTRKNPLLHTLLKNLGVEPLSGAFDGAYLHRKARGRKVAIKNFLMNSHIVVGIGNIYASESLFRAGIHPSRAAGRISLARMHRLAEAARQVLQESLHEGGTTLRDFVSGAGEPGYFKTRLQVYARHGETCVQCRQKIRLQRLGQRSTYYCPGCQT